MAKLVKKTPDIITLENAKLGDILTEQECPKCKEKKLKVSGVYKSNEKCLELECGGCFFTGRVNRKEFTLKYSQPKKEDRNAKRNGDEE